MARCLFPIVMTIMIIITGLCWVTEHRTLGGWGGPEAAGQHSIMNCMSMITIKVCLTLAVLFVHVTLIRCMSISTAMYIYGAK
jgi:hypothetical protein